MRRAQIGNLCGTYSEDDLWAEEFVPARIQGEPASCAEPAGLPFGQVQEAVASVAGFFNAVPCKEAARGRPDTRGAEQRAHALGAARFLIEQHPVERGDVHRETADQDEPVRADADVGDEGARKLHRKEEAREEGEHHLADEEEPARDARFA